MTFTKHSLVLGAGMLIAITACNSRETTSRETADGDPKRGAVAIRAYGCGSCHVIPGVAGATGLVGPSLERVGRRTYIAGVLPNTPNNMLLWIQFPQQIAPSSAMPNMDVTPKDAKDIAAYLYTLE